MKQAVLSIPLAAFGAILALASCAGAETITLGYAPYHQGVGGAFLATPVDGLGAAATAATNYAAEAKVGNGFMTFCMEYTEHFTPGNTYHYRTNTTVLLGGTVTGDPISVGTAYVYSLFATGQLDDLVGAFSYTSNASMGALQNALWFLEDEHGADAGIFTTLLNSRFGSVANAKGDFYNDGGILTAASFGVGVMNLGTTPDGNGGRWPNQDQLIYTGGGGQRVPDGGATVALLGLSIAGLGLAKRRMA